VLSKIMGYKLQPLSEAVSSWALSSMPCLHAIIMLPFLLCFSWH
jgi:hypothetical protein